MNSKQKGNRGEREFAKYLTDAGYPARRGVQYSGSPDSPDVICDKLPVHWEVKRTEKLNLYKAIEQVEADCPSGKWRVVAHKRNSGEWVAIMPMDDYMDLIKEWDRRRF